MKVTTAEQMRAVDRRASEEYGIPSVVLMESAGVAFARACIEELGGDVRGKRVAMVCGRGNNGGDGFVAARHLANAGADVTVFLSCRPGDLKGDAAAHFAPLPAMQIPVVPLLEETDLPALLDALPHFDLIGDALLGTGIRGPVEGIPARIVGGVNDAGVPVVAADIPSGVNADTGEVPSNGVAIQAARTVTFALPKRGLLLYPGAAHVGNLTVADIGIPRALLEDEALGAERVTLAAIRRALPRREQSRDANKGAFGTVLVLAGAAGMAGAAALTAVSALRAGAGLVMLAVPESLMDTAAVLAPEVVLKPLPETPERTHGGDGALDAALALAEKVDSVAVGPGLTRNKAAISLVQSFVQHTGAPVVIDADGLNALAEGDPEVTAGRHQQGRATVLTPHPGEASRLLGRDTRTVQEDRIGAVQEIATQYGAVTLLKGARTLIAPAGGGKLYLNRPGTPALGTAGSGDVLTGVVGALLATKEHPLTATLCAAYLHALAGEIAARELGVAGVIATDVRDRLPRARQMLYESDDLDNPL